MLILNEQHLERVLAVYMDHYNVHRPHRALGLAPPARTLPAAAPSVLSDERHVRRRDRLGGVVHEYVLAA
jgi:putative transposase